MPRTRKAKEPTPIRQEAEDLKEDVLCSEESCAAVITELDEQGWGICAAGHVGQPVPGTFRPEPEPDDVDTEIAEASAKHKEFIQDHGTHPCKTCMDVGYSHYEGGACTSVGDNGQDCGCEEFACALPKTKNGEEQSTFVDMEVERHNGFDVIERRAVIAGTVKIDRLRPESRDWWKTLKTGRGGRIVVSFDAGKDGHVPILQKGTIMGVAATWELKITGVSLPTSKDQTEGLPMWERERATQMTALFNGLGNMANVFGAEMTDLGKLEALEHIVGELQTLVSRGGAVEPEGNDLGSSLAAAETDEEDDDDGGE